MIVSDACVTMWNRLSLDETVMFTPGFGKDNSPALEENFPSGLSTWKGRKKLELSAVGPLCSEISQSLG